MIKTLAVIAVLAIPTASLGQSLTSEQIDDVRTNARGHVGPFYLTPAVALKELGVDSNVFNSAGERKSDFTFTVAPKVDVWVPMVQRALVKATVASDFVWYSTYESERSVNPQFSGRAELYLQRITLFADHSYLDTRQRANHEIDLRSRHVDNTTVAGVQVGLTSKTSIEIAGRRFDTHWDSDAIYDGTSLQRALNRETLGVELTGRHRLTPLTALAVRYDVLRDRFPFSPLRDSNSYRVMPGIEFEPQALIKGSAYIGYRQFTQKVPDALPDFSGLVGQLGLSYTLLGTTVFGVSYVRELAYSYEEQRPFFVDQSLGASVRHAIGSRFDVTVSADRHQYDYRNALLEGVPISDVQDVDVTWNYTGTIGYRVGRDGRAGFGISYWQRESTRSASRAYENLRFVSSLSYGF